MKRLATMFALLAALFTMSSATATASGVTGFTLATSLVTGGNVVGATIVIDSVAPTGGIVVDLESSSTALATVPSTVTVQAGKSAVQFNVVTKAVSEVSDVALTATLGTTTRTTSLRVVPAIVASLTLPTSIVGGKTGSATLKLTGKAATGGLTVTVSSSSSAASVPETVTVLAGLNYARFKVTTSIVDTRTSYTVTVTDNVHSVTKTAVVAAASVSSVSVSPSSVIGGTSSTGKVTLTGLSAHDITVSLSAASGLASPDATVTVPAGSLSATFRVATSSTTVQVRVAIYASYGGMSKTGYITVKPPIA